MQNFVNIFNSELPSLQLGPRRKLEMRTRFLCTDYSISSVIQAADFLRLPLPHLPLSSSEFEDLPRFDQLSIFGIDLGIKQLPIDKALSKFLSESFPNFIDVEIRDLDNAPSHSEIAASSKLTSSISNQNAEVIFDLSYARILCLSLLITFNLILKT